MNLFLRLASFYGSCLGSLVVQEHFSLCLVSSLPYCKFFCSAILYFAAGITGIQNTLVNMKETSGIFQTVLDSKFLVVECEVDRAVVTSETSYGSVVWFDTGLR